MITQKIIDKLKSNEIPYGILKTKDWFTDEVDQFMKEKFTRLVYYNTNDEWVDKNINILCTNSTYRLREDYILPTAKEVYELKKLYFNDDNDPYIINTNNINDNYNEYNIIENERFLGYYFGTKEEFEEYYKELITKVDRHYSLLYQKQGKIVNGKLDLKVAKYVIMKGKDYETN